MTDTTPQAQTMRPPAPATQVAGASAVPGGRPPLMVALFFGAMVVPVYMSVGSVLLMPHRIILLVMFFPLVFQLLTGRAGRIESFDWLMFFSCGWALIAIYLNENFLGGSDIQPIGVYVLESLGGYLLGRVAIRSRDDFTAFMRVFFLILLVLVPFALVESVTHRPILLELLPQSVNPVSGGGARWGMRRAQTVFSHPILFGVFSGIGFGLFWYMMRTRVMQVGGAALAAAGTFFSLSTGALISITLQIVFMTWESMTKRYPRRWTVFAALSVLAYFAIDLLSNRTPFHVLVTYASFNTGSSYNRILIWRYGMENVWANPWFGLGENVQTWARPSWMSSSADNFWLLHAMKFGIPSFLAMAAALFIIIRRVARAPLKDVLAQACRAGYLTTVGGLIIAGGTVHFWHGVMAFVMFMFGAGVWMIQAGRDDAARPEGAGAAADAEPAPDSGLVYTRQPARHNRTKSASRSVLVPPARSASRKAGG